MKLKGLVLAAAIGLASPSVEADESISVRENSGSVYNKNRQSGELDLMRIAADSCNSDRWIYSSGKWYDVGIHDGNSLQFDASLVNRIMNETSGDLFNYEIRNDQSCGDSNGSISLEPLQLNNILSHVYLSELAKNNRRRVQSLIVDRHGVWRYTVSNQLAENIIELNAEVLNGVEDAIADASDWILDIPRAIFNFRLNLYEERMQSSGIYVSYTRIR